MTNLIPFVYISKIRLMKGPFKQLNEIFPYPLIYLTREIPTLSCPSSEEKAPP